MKENNYKQVDLSEPIDITTESAISGRLNEKGVAKLVMQDYAKHAQKTEGWSEFKLCDVHHYDDVDGSDMGPNRPGVEAIIEVKSPSGQLYRSWANTNEEALKLIHERENPEIYQDCLVRDEDW